MTTTLPAPAVPVVVKEPPKPAFYQNTWPVFILDDNTKLEDVRALNEPLCFVIGFLEVEGTTANSKVKRPTMLRMNNGAFAYSLNDVSFGQGLGVKEVVKEEAQLKLPKIPWEFMLEIEMFFRHVDDTIGTEAIVQLTYDESFLGKENAGDGWGYYVPEQKNTGVACFYEKDEINEYLIEHNLMLVGSVHSHPGMSAYASHADEKDQSNWHGLHITIGWYANAAAHFHVEMIHGGASWKFQPHQVIEAPPLPEVDQFDYSNVVDRVSKKEPVKSTYPSYSHGGYSGGGYNSGWNSTATSSATHSGPTVKVPHFHLPVHAPKPTENVIIWSREKDETQCRVCHAPITPTFELTHRCYACESYYLDEGMTLVELIQYLGVNQLEVPDFLDADQPKNPIWIWDLDCDEKGVPTHSFELVAGEPKKADAPKK